MKNTLKKVKFFPENKHVCVQCGMCCCTLYIPHCMSKYHIIHVHTTLSVGLKVLLLTATYRRITQGFVIKTGAIS